VRIVQKNSVELEQGSKLSDDIDKTNMEEYKKKSPQKSAFYC